MINTFLISFSDSTLVRSQCWVTRLTTPTKQSSDLELRWGSAWRRERPFSSLSTCRLFIHLTNKSFDQSMAKNIWNILKHLKHFSYKSVHHSFEPKQVNSLSNKSRMWIGTVFETLLTKVCNIHLDQSMDEKICWKLSPKAVECAAILQMGGWISRNGWVLNEMSAERELCPPNNRIWSF